MEQLIQRWKSLPPLTRYLLPIFPLLFFIWALTLRTPAGADLYSSLIFKSNLFESREPWRAISFVFLEDVVSPLAFIFSAIVVYFTGRDLERFWGTRRFGTALIVIWALGVVFAVVGEVLGVTSVQSGMSLVVFYGLIPAWGMVFKEKQILLFMVVPVKGKFIVILTGIYLVLQAVSLSAFPFMLAIGHFAGALILTSSFMRKISLPKKKTRKNHKDFRVIDGGGMIN